jgi:hypothetical protein
MKFESPRSPAGDEAAHFRALLFSVYYHTDPALLALEAHAAPKLAPLPLEHAVEALAKGDRHRTQQFRARAVSRLLLKRNLSLASKLLSRDEYERLRIALPQLPLHERVTRRARVAPAAYERREEALYNLVHSVLGATTAPRYARKWLSIDQYLVATIRVEIHSTRSFADLCSALDPANWSGAFPNFFADSYAVTRSLEPVAALRMRAMELELPHAFAGPELAQYRRPNGRTEQLSFRLHSLQVRGDVARNDPRAGRPRRRSRPALGDAERRGGQHRHDRKIGALHESDYQCDSSHRPLDVDGPPRARRFGLKETGKAMASSGFRRNMSGPSALFDYFERWGDVYTGAWKKQMDVWRGAHCKIQERNYGASDCVTDACTAWSEWLCSMHDLCSHTFGFGVGGGCDVPNLAFVVDFAAETTDPCCISIDPTLTQADIQCTPLTGFGFTGSPPASVLISNDYLETCLVAPGELEVRLVDLDALRPTVSAGHYYAAVFSAVPAESAPLAVIHVVFQPP